MTRRNVLLIAITLALAGIYVISFTDWFRAETIHISYTSRPGGFARRLGWGNRPAATAPVFGFAQPYQLTEIKVVPLAAFRTNSLAQPLWHLVSSSGSDPVGHFFYGQKIKGMEPFVSGAQPQPLQPGVVYRLLVQAASLHGQRDFHVGVDSANTVTNR